MIGVAIVLYLYIGFVLASLAYQYKWSQDDDSRPIRGTDEFLMALIFWPTFTALLLINKWIRLLDKKKS